MKKKRTIVTMILCVIILALIGYICYEKGVFEKNNSIQNNNTENNITITKTDEYKMLTDDDYKNYLVKRDDSGYKVLRDLGEYINYIGIYDNKFYYSDTKIKYIDLNDSNLTEIVWLEIPQLECLNCKVKEERLIDYSAIIDNYLFFSLDSGLSYINMKASTFSEYKNISSLAEAWFADADNKKIYYRDENGIYMYDILSEKTEELFKVESMFDRINYVSNKIVYYNYFKDELTLFDVNSKKSSIIANNLSVISRDNGSMWGISFVVGKNLYYNDGEGKIIKYDAINDSKVTYYEFPDSFYLKAYSFYDDNNFEIFYDCNRQVGNVQGHICASINEFVSNGKIVEQFPSIFVTMLDGSVKTFTIKNFESSK